MRVRNVSLGLAAILAPILAASFADSALAEVKIRGATTVAFGLINPQKAKIEKMAGVELAVLPNSTMHGLADLVHRRADIAMLAEPLETAVAALNKQEATPIDIADYVEKHVGDAFVEFIVHPINPVQRLTRAQLADLYSGKIKNWSELGGSNQPVLLVGEPTSSPYRLIKDALDISYSPTLRAVQNTNQVAVIVVQAPGALGNISTAHDMPERGKFKVMETDVKIPLRLYVAIRKDASPDVKRVVEAAASVGAP